MLQISMAMMYSDRTAALYDRRVPIEGCEAHCVLLRPGEVFHRIFKFEEFDVAEMSLSSHMLTTARGDSKYIGIPAFPLRMFRHSGVYVRNDRGIDRPEDLRGKTIGLPEFQQTANVWIRGMLQDEYGVDTASVHWRTGGLEEPGREERADIKLLKDIDWQVIPRDRKALKVTWSEVKPPFPNQARLHDHIRAAKVIKREYEIEHGSVETVFARSHLTAGISASTRRR